ncbi:MAG: cyanase [Rubrobacteraceae bacterium]
MTREEVTQQILEARKRKGLAWTAIANKVGRDKVWTTAALMGQTQMGEDEAQVVVDLLDLDPDAIDVLQECPTRGSLAPTIPTDPLIYRFYEIMQVYGAPMKELIHEEFGDGIMSAIDFEAYVEREEDPAGDRVKITYSGKFLPYRKW